jgi:SAM-dependent methyltransferase
MVELCLFKLILKSDINHTQKKILKNIQHRPKILEVGCGNGSRLELFSKLNAEVIGVDMSQEDIATAKAKGLNAFCADVNDLEKYFEPNSFDIVMSFDVLEHIPNLGEFFKKLSQLLKPGGWMMAGMPSSDCFAIRILGKRWAALSEVPRHVSIPSLGGTRCLFERADLRELDYFPYGSLSCSLVLGLSLFPGGSANHFYSSGFSVLRWCQRILGGLMMFLTVPLFWGENHLTKHSSRFVMIGRKELEVKPEGC